MSKFRLTRRRLARSAAAVMLAGGLAAATGPAQHASAAASAAPRPGAAVGHPVRYRAIGTDQAGHTVYAAASRVRGTILVGTAPRFAARFPPRMAAAGKAYAYQFTATGCPGLRFALRPGPPWLRVNSITGQLSGTVPRGTTSFRYVMTVVNPVGRASAGFTIRVR